MSRNALAEAEPKVNVYTNQEKRPANPKTVLQELFALLEEYGPEWYDEEHHNRAVAALRESA